MGAREEEKRINGMRKRGRGREGEGGFGREGQEEKKGEIKGARKVDEGGRKREVRKKKRRQLRMGGWREDI